MIKDRIDEYNKESEVLFAEWKNTQGVICSDADNQVIINHKDSVFIRDGVVCPEVWYSQEIRPLFLLKEAYGGDGDWDLAKDHLLVHKSIDKIWERVSDWTKGIFATTNTEIPPYIQDSPEIAHYGNEYLKKIAVINVKKSGGKSSSDYDEISAYALFDKDRLLRQIELCDPTIIVCGYTGSYLEMIIGENFRKPRNDNLFYRIELKGHSVLVLDFWHPANHYPDIMNYYGFLGIYQNSLKTKCNK